VKVRVAKAKHLNATDRKFENENFKVFDARRLQRPLTAIREIGSACKVGWESMC